MSFILSSSLLQWNFNQNTKTFIQENASENIVCEMAAILSGGDELINDLLPDDTNHQTCSMAFTPEQFQKKCSWTQSVTYVQILKFSNYYCISHRPMCHECFLDWWIRIMVMGNDHCMLAVPGNILCAKSQQGNKGQLISVWHINPLHAIFFRENINIYLHFISFLHINKTQVVEIPPWVRQGPAYST